MGQFLGFIYAFFLMISIWGKTSKQILYLQTISFFFKGIHYYLLNGISGFITSIISMIRNLLFSKIKSNKIGAIIFIVIYILVGIITYQNLYSILPVLATITYTIIINKDNPNYLRWGMFLTSLIWLDYNICIISYSGIITQIIALISNLIAIIKLDKKP